MERRSGVRGVREEEAVLGLGDQDEMEKKHEICTRYISDDLGVPWVSKGSTGIASLS